MRKRCGAIFALVFGCCTLAACGTDQQNTPEAEASADGWTIERMESAMDGSKIVASKSVDFPDRGASFEINTSCGAGGEWSGVRVSSYVGAEGKDPAARFVATGRFPQGRLKQALEHQPRGLDYLFLIGDYANEITLNESYMVDQHRRTKAVPSGVDSPPKAAIFASLLPLVLEVRNGRGSFELTVSSSEPLMEVLTACGAEPGSSLISGIEPPDSGPPKTRTDRARAPENAMSGDGLCVHDETVDAVKRQLFADAVSVLSTQTGSAINADVLRPLVTIELEDTRQLRRDGAGARCASNYRIEFTGGLAEFKPVVGGIAYVAHQAQDGSVTAEWVD